MVINSYKVIGFYKIDNIENDIALWLFWKSDGLHKCRFCDIYFPFQWLSFIFYIFPLSSA